MKLYLTTQEGTNVIVDIGSKLLQLLLKCQSNLKEGLGSSYSVCVLVNCVALCADIPATLKHPNQEYIP